MQCQCCEKSKQIYVWKWQKQSKWSKVKLENEGHKSTVFSKWWKYLRRLPYLITHSTTPQATWNYTIFKSKPSVTESYGINVIVAMVTITNQAMPMVNIKKKSNQINEIMIIKKSGDQRVPVCLVKTTWHNKAHKGEKGKKKWRIKSESVSGATAEWNHKRAKCCKQTQQKQA